jgi:hypothetical protein
VKIYSNHEILNAKNKIEHIFYRSAEFGALGNRTRGFGRKLESLQTPPRQNLERTVK